MEEFKLLEEVKELIPNDENISKEDISNIKEYGGYVESIIEEENTYNVLINANNTLIDIVKDADDEVTKYGTLSNETASELVNAYNVLSSLLGEDNLSTESAICFKKELYYLTKENGSKSWLRKIIDKFIAFCKSIYYKVVEYGTKLGVAVTRQEITASNLASYITDTLDNFKIDKWEYMIPYGDIVGNFTILKNFNRSSIETYVKFNNGGFQSDKLVKLYMDCIEKGNMDKFRKLESIPVDYDISSYFKEYKNSKVVPIDISGATGHCLLSYEVDGVIKLERKKFKIIADSGFKSSLSSKGILSREDMVSILRQINISVRDNRDNITRLYEHIRNIHKVIMNINEGTDKKFISDAIHCGTILVNSLSLSSRVGLFSNSFIIGVIGRMAKVYKKQTKIRE